MTNQANIDININDAQVESLVNSLQRLTNSLNDTQREFNETERASRQAGTAMRQSGQGGSAGGRGIQQMGQKMATASRAIVAGGAALGAFAVAAGATVVAVKTLEVGIEQGKEAFRAYISTAEETKEQFQDLTANASQLQLQLGKTILEVIGGEEAFDTFNQVVEAGIQFLENFRDAISDSANGMSVADAGARLLVEAFALLFRVLAEGQRILELTVASFNFLGNFSVRGLIDEIGEINEAYGTTRDLIREVRRGEVDLSRRSARDPIRIAVEGAGGGAGDGVTEGDRQIIAAIEALETGSARTQEILNDELKRALMAATGNMPTEMGKAATQRFMEGGLPLTPDSILESQNRLGELLEHQRSLRVEQQNAERNIEEAGRRQQIASREMARVGALRAQAASLEADAAERLTEAERQRNLIPSIPTAASVGVAAGLGAVGVGGAAGGIHRSGRFLGELGRVDNAGELSMRRGLARLYGQAGARGTVTAFGRMAARGATRFLGGPIGAAGAVVGGAAGGARAYMQRQDAIAEFEAASTAATEASQQASQLISQADQIRSSTSGVLETQAATLGEAVAMGVDLTRLGVEARVNADAVVETSADIQAFRFNEEKQAQNFLDERLQREQDYFAFIQRGIRGTKEEAARYISFIEGTPLEAAFRMGAAAGADPLAPSGFARDSIQETMIASVRGEGGFTRIGPQPGLLGGQGTGMGFASMSRDLDLEMEGFRGIAADDTFPSVQLFLEAINDELTEQERKWAELNGGIVEYMKAIEASKTATRNAFKTDAISGFTGAIEQVSATIGTAIAGGFDDGLKGGERVKKLLATILGDFLKTIGSTAIAQGAIVAFGDPAIGGLPNPARAAGLIAAGSAAVIAGSALSGAAAGIGGKRQGATSPGAGSSFGVGGGGGSGDQTTQIFIENRFGNRFDARELDRAAADSFARAAAAGQA